jgi:hypothetical protein
MAMRSGRVKVVEWLAVKYPEIIVNDVTWWMSGESRDGAFFRRFLRLHPDYVTVLSQVSSELTAWLAGEDPLRVEAPVSAEGES